MNDKRKALVAVLSVFALSTAGAGLLSGCNGSVGHINAPTELEADLGTYVVPDYDVVDENGMILAGYNVYLKSVKDANGEELPVSYGSVTVDTAGVYSFVYSAGSKKVKDATVSIDFADRTAPTINYDERNLPDFFIRGNEYRMPAYTLSGDYVREKCWAKVYYIAEDNTETEVKIESGRFKVDKDKGSYAIRIHVEDAVGNPNDYEYVRKVDGPETLVENRVLYFNEEFGARQVSCYEDCYKGEYVSKDTDGAKVYGDEEGAYKVTFDGVTETSHNEGYISMRVPALINLYEYEHLEMWVYNDSENDVNIGSNWWNDTKIEKGKWNRIVWNTREWGGANGNKDVSNTKYVGVTDISGTVIRFIFDYDEEVIPNGTFYFSSMNAEPKVPATVTETACETENGGVNFDQSKYYINDTVILSAKKVDGKVIDCFKVDGKVIPGNTFTVTETTHAVQAVYADDPLTLKNMTWATPDNYTLVGDDAQTYKLGEGKKWVLSYDVHGVDTGWNYFAAYVGGSNQLLGFELAGSSGKFCGYGGSYAWINGVALSSEILDILHNATEQKPATIKYLRDGNLVKTFVEYEGKSYFVATVDIVETLGCRSGNGFGIGGRSKKGGNITNLLLHNIQAVANDTKTELVHATYSATVTGDGVCVFEDREYRVGDIVTLTAPEKKGEQLFLCFKVDGKDIAGDSFAISGETVNVSAVYTDPCTVTLAEGLSVDGKTGEIVVPAGKVITVMFTGTSPDGKYYSGVEVDGTASGETITITKDTAVTAKYADRIDNDNEVLNDISNADAVTYKPKKKAWKPASVEYVTNFGYDGEDGTVDAKNSVKVTLSGGEQAFGFNNGAEDLGKYSEFYFYAYTRSSGIKMGSWWCNDTALVAGEWTLVKFDRTKEAQNVSQQNVWEHGLNQFIYRVMGGKAGDVVYVTALYGVPYPDVTVTEERDSAEYLGLSEPKYGENYKENETVTLTCTGAPQSKAFVCFTVNGADIDGDTYKLTGAGAEFGIRFEDVATITVGDGVIIAGKTADEDGTYTVGVGSKIKLSFDTSKLDGKVVDYYEVNSDRIYNGGFTATEKTYNVSAVLAEPNAITWADGGTAYNYETVMGTDAAAEWKARSLDGEVYGSAEYWAVSVDVKHTKDWQSFEFIQGTKQSIRVRFHQDGFCGIVLMTGKDSETTPGSEFTVAYNPDNLNASKKPAVVNKLVAGATVTCVRNGGTISMYIDNELFFTTNYSVDHTGDWFGVGHVTANDATKPAMTNTKYITGKDKIEAFLENAGVITVGSGLDGSVVKYTGTTYTVPAATAKNLSGNTLPTPVTTTVKNAEGDVLELNDGKITIPEYDGVQYITIIYSAAGCKDVTVKVNLQKEGGDVLMQASALGAATIDANGNTVYYDTAKSFGDEDGSIKVTLASNETAIKFNKTDLSGYRYLEFYIYTDADNVQTGAWWNQDVALVKNTWRKVIIDLNYTDIDLGGGAFPLRLGGTWNADIKGANNVVDANVYISSVKLIKATEKSSENQINAIQFAMPKDVSAATYITTGIPEGLNTDEVTESGVLKLTAGSNDVGLASKLTYDKDTSKYSSVYFYVYVESETDIVGNVAGIWWTGDTVLKAKQWNKISLTNYGTAGSNFEELVLRICKASYIDGSQSIQGTTFYVTSVYGVPKTT